MKKILAQILIGALVAAASARADTALTFGNVTIHGTIGPCWQDVVLYSNFFGVDGAFTLNGVSGTGAVHSSLFEAVNFGGGGSSHLVYTYGLDLSQIVPGCEPLPQADHTFRHPPHLPVTTCSLPRTVRPPTCSRPARHRTGTSPFASTPVAFHRGQIRSFHSTCFPTRRRRPIT